MKSNKSIFTLSCLLLFLLPFFGGVEGGSLFAQTVIDSGVCGENITYILKSDGSLTISGTGAMNNYSTINDVPWYGFRYDVLTVTIGSGVTIVGNYVFFQHYNLKSVIFEGRSAVTVIGECAFRDCRALKEIKTPPSIKQIDLLAFMQCVNLEKVEIGAGVTSIGAMAFQQCTSLMTIIVKSPEPPVVSSNTFSGVPETVNIYITCGSDLLYMGDPIWSLFANFTSNLPFSGTCGENLTWELDCKGNMTIEGAGPMDGFGAIDPPWLSLKHKIKTVAINSGVTTVGWSAFQSYGELTSVKIGNSVSMIDYGAFYSCVKLTSITIGNSVNMIEEWAFAYCKNLGNITIHASTPPVFNDNTFMEINDVSLSVPCGTEGDYSQSGWNIFYISEYQINVPTDITVTGTEDGLTISWEGNGSSYDLYRNNIWLTTLNENVFTNINLNIGYDYCYKVRALGLTCESAFSEPVCKTFTGSGIDNYELGIGNYELVVFPNPTTGVFTVTARGHVSLSEKSEIFELFDIFGNSFSISLAGGGRGWISPSFGGGRGEVDISHLPSGIYILKVNNQSIKVIKK